MAKCRRGGGGAESAILLHRGRVYYPPPSPALSRFCLSLVSPPFFRSRPRDLGQQKFLSTEVDARSRAKFLHARVTRHVTSGHILLSYLYPAPTSYI